MVSVVLVMVVVSWVCVCSVGIMMVMNVSGRKKLSGYEVGICVFSIMLMIVDVCQFDYSVMLVLRKYQWWQVVFLLLGCVVIMWWFMVVNVLLVSRQVISYFQWCGRCVSVGVMLVEYSVCCRFIIEIVVVIISVGVLLVYNCMRIICEVLLKMMVFIIMVSYVGMLVDVVSMLQIRLNGIIFSNMGVSVSMLV